MSVKHISNLGAGSYLRSKNISVTNLSVDVLHISSELVLTNDILASHAIINLSSKDQLKLGASTLTQILDNIEIDTSNLSIGILNISENLNLSVLNSSINMMSGTTLNLSNTSQMLINGSTLHQLLNQTSATDLSVSSLTLLGTNTCVNINENGKLNVSNFNQIVDTNLCTLTDKLDDKQDTLSTTNELTLTSNQLGVNSIAQSKITGLSNSFNAKQNNICVTDGLTFSNSQVGVNTIAQSKITGLSNSFNAKQNNICVKDGLSFSNSQVGVNSIAHTKIGFANGGTIAFPGTFQLNFQGANGELNMANGRIKNGTGGIVSLDINQGNNNYDGYINMHNNTCLNMCGNSNIRVADFNQILKGTTNLQATLNTYTLTSAFDATVATLATTAAVNSLLNNYVTSSDFSTGLNTKQTAIIGTDNIETYTYGTGSLAFSNIRLKSEINLTKINAQEVDFSNNAIDFDMIDGLITAFQNKQNVLSLGTNLEFDSNTCDLQLKNEINLTKINSSDVNFSDDSIAQVMVNGLTSALSGKQSTLTLAGNLQFDGNNDLDLHSNISVNNISLDIDGTITDLGTYLTTTTAPLTGFFNISVHNGSIDTNRDMNLSSLNVSDINVNNLEIILNGTFGMRNTQLPARKGELEITTSSFNISSSGGLPIGFKISNTKRMELTSSELTLDCNLSQGQNYSANISNLTSNMILNSQIYSNVAIIQNSNSDKLYIDAYNIGTNHFDVYSTGIPIHFNVNTNPFNNINNMEMTSTKTLFFMLASET